MKKATFGLEENLAGLCCYAVVFFTGIIFLVMEKENKSVRFHALQSTIWFLIVAVIGWAAMVLSKIPVLGLPFMLVNTLIGFVALVSWLFLMFKAFKGEQFKIPVIGDVVEAQVNK